MKQFRAVFDNVAPKLKSMANDAIKIINKPVQEHLSFHQTESEQIIEITPKLYWMTFPAPDKIQKISNRLNQKFGNNYYIWNISEHSYESEFFQNQVAVHSHPGLPCPSLMEILTIIKNILMWLSSDQENVAIIHCQQTRGRSVMIISSLLSIMGAGHDYQALFPSQHQYLTYVGNLTHGLKLNNSGLRLISVVFSSIPQVEDKANFQPYIQFFKNDKIIYNSLGEGKIKSYKQDDLSCIFDIHGLDVSEDVLIRCKHFESNQNRIALFRIMFNCSFIFENVLRVWSREIDKTSSMKVENDFFIDFLFERGDQRSSQTQNIIAKHEETYKGTNFLLYQIVQESRALVAKYPHVCQGLEYKLEIFSPIVDSPIVDQKEFVQVKLPESGRSSEEKQDEEENEECEKSAEHKEMVNKILSQIPHDQEDDDMDDYFSKLEQQE